PRATSATPRVFFGAPLFAAAPRVFVAGSLVAPLLDELRATRSAPRGFAGAVPRDSVADVADVAAVVARVSPGTDAEAAIASAPESSRTGAFVRAPRATFAADVSARSSLVLTVPAIVPRVSFAAAFRATGAFFRVAGFASRAGSAAGTSCVTKFGGCGVEPFLLLLAIFLPSCSIDGEQHSLRRRVVPRCIKPPSLT